MRTFKVMSNGSVLVTEPVMFCIDEIDLPMVLEHKWSLDRDGNVVTMIDGKRKMLHRLIMQPEANQIVQHKSGKLWNNRRSNLRTILRGVELRERIWEDNGYVFN